MHDLRALAGFFAPDVDQAITNLDGRIGGFLTDNEALRSALMTGLQRDCFELCHRTLIAHYSLVSASVAFVDYCRTIAEPDGRAHIYAKYPVLSRLLNQLAGQWVDRVYDIVIRFRDDKTEIEREIFSSSPLGRLSDIQFGLGDRHRDGRAVALLMFEGGQKLIYKPRSLSIDLHFTSFLEHLSHITSLNFVTPPTISLEQYGWVGFIEQKACLNEEEILLYYERLGGLLAALYILNAFDFHYENIVAHGTSPVLIDLETFYHPHAPIVGTETNTSIDDSVLMTGLLPDEITFRDGRTADISGMTDVSGQDGVVSRLTINQDGAGKFVFERMLGKLLGAKNMPMIDAVVAGPTPDRIARLRVGFAKAYRAVANHPSVFRVLIDNFAGDEVRVIFRATLTYSHMLDESRHPALMLSEDRLNQYFRSLSNLSVNYALGEVLLPFEVNAMQRRDVPLFTCRVGSTDLLVDEVDKIDGFFVSDGLDLVHRKLSRLDEEDLGRQLWIINKSFKIANGGILRLPTDSIAIREAGENQSLADRYMSQAIIIADYICDSVHEGDRHASWLVMKSLNESNSRLAIWNAFYDLYGGMPGEIAFLIQMHKATGNERYRRVALKAYDFLHDRISESQYAIRPLGLFGGWGSVLFLEAALARWTDNPSYLARAESIFERVDFANLISVDRNLAMVKGAAGFLLACAEHIRATGSKSALSLANAAFDHLLQQRADPDGPMSWKIASERPLSGLSHGASGFAACFARMFEVTQDQRYSEACLSALAFERTLFLPETGNWLDQRDHAHRDGDAPTGMSWAHGAPGIGIARLAIIKSGICDDTIRDELEIAMRSTLAAELSGTLAAVSGDFGTIELPVGYAELIGFDYWPDTRRRLVSLIEDLERRTATLGDNDNTSLGLMNGITGAGYQCLRIGSSRPISSLVGLRIDTTRSLELDRT